MELMILPFTTKIKGKPTYFVEKIWQGFIEQKIFENVARYVWLKGTPYPKDNDRFKIGRKFNPKIHTIREDKNNRWKPGVLIDFFINARQKDMFRFAPRIPVVSTQKIKIKYTKSSGDTPLIYIEVFGNKDYKCLDTYNPQIKESAFKWIEKLAYNDGFESVEEFLKYFNEDFEGKIIHWTNFKY